MRDKNISIIGTVGVPANYGGFETLVENLVRYHDDASLKDSLSVYCSSKSYPSRQKSYLSARLHYVPLSANGAQSIPYDVLSLFSALWQRSDVILLLGVSGAIALPLVRLFSSACIVCNIDGIEWHRKKWQGLPKHFLRFSEKLAVRFSHKVITDNEAIAEYVSRVYGVKGHVIAYGGDNAIKLDAVAMNEYSLPSSYALSVCRIEPENNVHMLVEALSMLKCYALVMVGNWNNNEYGRELREKYASCGNLFLLDPIYDLGKLKTLRMRASFYVHGHSVGGTNPSLVEAMHFGKAVLAFDCNYNRSTTEDKALYFGDSAELQQLITSLDKTVADKVGRDMLEIANRRYTWSIVAEQYFALLGDK